MIDIIIPVYNQRELTRNCLESVMGTVSPTCAEIVVINDASSDEVLCAYLRGLEASGQINLIEHATNAGFVRSVNEGMRLNCDRDIILLNSDTIVYGDWVQRLRRAAFQQRRIGTSNPLTNFGGSHIAFYPKRKTDKPLEVSDAELDEIARVCNAGRIVDAHTTVGFCMFIKRDVLDDVGLFDDINFPRAYGEEADFCYRAGYIGWKHVIAADVFVSHLHGMSFGKEKKSLMREMLKTFERLHPQYVSMDAEFWSRDALKSARCCIDLHRLARFIENFDGTLEIVLANGSGVTGALLMSLDTGTGALSFLPPPGVSGLHDLPLMNLPQDIAFVAGVLNVIGVRRIVYGNVDCRDAIEVMTSGESYEMDWYGLMPNVDHVVAENDGSAWHFR